MVKKNTCIFISGEGSNLKNLIMEKKYRNILLQVNLQTSIGRWKPTRKDTWPYSAKKCWQHFAKEYQAILRDFFDACPDTGEIKSVGNKILG